MSADIHTPLQEALVSAEASTVWQKSKAVRWLDGISSFARCHKIQLFYFYMQIRIISLKICTWFDNNMEFIKDRTKQSHLNKFILQKYICWNNNPLSYIVFGKRFINVIHTKLRYRCRLFYDLYKYNNTNTPFCACGHNEDV